MLDREYNYYKANKNKLLKEYDGKFIGLVGEEVVGSFDSELEAYRLMKERFGAGNFLLQHCVLADSDRIQRYHSRVAFR